jgi:DNA-binding FadR family transcriptional regulator
MELYEIRQRLELSYVREATHTLSDESFAEMERLFAEMEAHFRADEAFNVEDLALHRTLFHNVGNGTLLKLFDIFGSIYTNTRHLFRDQPRDVIIQDLDNHRLLLDALRARDEELAAQRLEATFDPLPALNANKTEREPTL